MEATGRPVQPIGASTPDPMARGNAARKHGGGYGSQPWEPEIDGDTNVGRTGWSSDGGPIEPVAEFRRKRCAAVTTHSSGTKGVSELGQPRGTHLRSDR